MRDFWSWLVWEMKFMASLVDQVGGPHVLSILSDYDKWIV